MTDRAPRRRRNCLRQLLTEVGFLLDLPVKDWKSMRRWQREGRKLLQRVSHDRSVVREYLPVEDVLKYSS